MDIPRAAGRNVAESGGSRIATSAIIYASRAEYGATYQNFFDIQLELGSTATPYEPFTPNSPSPDYPSPIISAAGIIRSEDRNGNGVQYDTGILRAIPDGQGSWAAQDREYIARVGNEWHRFREQRVGRVVYDGSESNWNMFVGADLNQFFTLQADVLHNAAAARTISSHYKRWYINARAGNYGTVYTHSSGIAFNDNRFQIPPLGEDRTQVLANWRAWLAANPVTVDYQLATPITHDLGPIDLPSYYPFTRVLVEGEYPPEVTARCRVVEG